MPDKERSPASKYSEKEGNETFERLYLKDPGLLREACDKIIDEKSSMSTFVLPPVPKKP